MPSPLLALENVSKRFGGTTALDRVDWSVHAGEVHCLVGENGSGKSTLIKIVAGVHAPDPGGRIVVGGQNYPALAPHDAKAHGIQVIYQDLSLFPNLTVLENIGIDLLVGTGLRPPQRRRMRERAEATLASLDAQLPLDARVGALSVAERQMVAICRGLAIDARLLFMDEATASLTRHEVRLLLGVVERLVGLGVSVVFVSHRLGEVVEIAERVTVLRDGRNVGTFPAREIDDRRLAELMTGERIEARSRAHRPERQRTVLEVKGATRQGEFSDVSFSLREGEILGLTGLLGAGRTELALALFGMVRLDRGQVLVDGTPVQLRVNRDAIGAGIAYVTEDRLALGLNLRQSIADNVSVTVLDRLRDRFGMVSASRRNELSASWISQLGIKAGDPGAPVQTLSGGNQQRVVIAKWLATEPRVLILDGPTVGVDIRNRQGIYDVIHGLAAQGTAILLISDEIQEVHANADRILHMRAGRIVDEWLAETTSEAAVAQAVHA